MAKGYTNVGKLRRLLRRLPDDLTEHVKVAIKEAAEAVYTDAVSAVPKDSGELARAISLSTSPDGLSTRVGFSKRLSRTEWNEAGWRAKFVEFGTKGYQAAPMVISRRVKTDVPGERKSETLEVIGYIRKRANSKTTSIGMRDVPARPAQPFLAPAFERNREWAGARIREAIREAIARAAAG
ncbi:HK97 family phage protein [Magnetospirillum sp. XM-1]|uniref:HK97-gp10 family putative phage morphogenesis protein n=1 Tax=Magnetospirillum sp. XM-1 TaxID=1663591 RepID=UPI00073DD4E9|nr:HK97-gp10 family putative phage morphogenesis protein [Magnetospirillum sp. XM-1]CUW39288.1 HK97 family phage protein [Magnetospirillum sp. XM-1]